VEQRQQKLGRRAAAHEHHAAVIRRHRAQPLRLGPGEWEHADRQRRHGRDGLARAIDEHDAVEVVRGVGALERAVSLVEVDAPEQEQVELERRRARAEERRACRELLERELRGEGAQLRDRLREVDAGQLGELRQDPLPLG
jgi:hypothetical protein